MSQTATRDTAAPGLTIELDPAAFNAENDTIEATFTFTEAVTGFDLTNDVTVTGGTAPDSLTESATQGEAGKVWTGTFTATGSTGDLEITVAQDSVQDNAGNTGPAADVSQTATRDTTTRPSSPSPRPTP